MAAPTARSGPVAAFVRFVICGGGVTLLAGGALLLIGHRVPFAVANAVVTVASTVLATELHGRFTFGRGRAGWSDHAAGGLTVALSYAFTTGAMLAFDGFHPAGGVLLRQGVYLAASGLAGMARFLLLRHVVFATPGPPRVPERVRRRAATTGSAGRRVVPHPSGSRLRIVLEPRRPSPGQPRPPARMTGGPDRSPARPSGGCRGAQRPAALSCRTPGTRTANSRTRWPAVCRRPVRSGLFR
ncbi:hypothetical protein [Streptomyces sp. IBSBF 2435]|uniref:hypothetical protein n=1 Tax=Streptomyces sp. IBSBF 2435 TaxID=2903531 RepID=UPI002FDC7383